VDSVDKSLICSQKTNAGDGFVVLPLEHGVRTPASTPAQAAAAEPKPRELDLRAAPGAMQKTSRVEGA
jgi:hypothetical protein